MPAPTHKDEYTEGLIIGAPMPSMTLTLPTSSS
jgi:hypothetical protein